MRFPGDNKGDMFGPSISNAEVEGLLTGSDPVGRSDLDLLAPLVSMLRAYGARVPSPEAVQRVATEAAATAREVRAAAGARVGADPAAWSSRAWLKPRYAGALAALLLVLGTSGVAIAADNAAPGAPLYGLDRALERIGIGAGRVDERLEEATSLVADGQAQQALSHLADAFAQAEEDGEDVSDLAEARSEVEAAAARLLDGDDSGSGTEENIEALLRYIRDNVHQDVGADGRSFGQGVAQLARRIAMGEAATPNRDEPGTTSTTGTTPGNDGGGGNSNGGGGNNGNGNNGGGNNGGGNGPPDDSPSETAPGRGNRP
jgi:hypothetical protein